MRLPSHKQQLLHTIFFPLLSVVSGRVRNLKPELLTNSLGSSIHTQWLLQKEVHRAGDPVTRVGGRAGAETQDPSRASDQNREAA